MPAPIDVSASNPVASAIAGVGMAFVDKAKRLKEEKQASQDRLAMVEFRNQSRIAERKYGAAVKDATSEKEIDAAMEERAASLNGFLSDRDVSDDVRKLINADADYFRQESYILGESSKAELQARKEREATETAALDMASSGDLQGALLAIEDSPAFADDEKIRMKSRLQSEFDRIFTEQYDTAIADLSSVEEADALLDSVSVTDASPARKEIVSERIKRASKRLYRESEKVAMEAYRGELGLLQSAESVDALLESAMGDESLGEVAKLRMRSYAADRKLTIRKSHAKRDLDSIRAAEKDVSLIDKNVIVSELQLSDAITDDKLRESVIAVLNSKGGDRGVESQKFIDLEKKLKEDRQGMSSWFDVDSNTKSEIFDFLYDESNSEKAKLAIVQEAMLRHVVDLDDGDLEVYLNVVEKDGKKVAAWAEGDLELNDYQVQAVTDLAHRMKAYISPAITEKGSWLRSPISSNSARRIFIETHSVEFFNNFKDIKTPEEYTKKYNEVVKPMLERAIQEHALTKYRNRLMEIQLRAERDVVE